MGDRFYLDLYHEAGQRFFIRPDRFQATYEEIQEFLSLENNMNTLEFAKKVMFSHELKANNQVEGYTDDFQLIEDVVRRIDHIKDKKQKQRIINLFLGYKFILTHSSFSELNLKKLYAILSKDLLEPSDASRMGEKYREGIVYILKNGRLDDSMTIGPREENIQKLIEHYFQFAKSSNMDPYITSQILHFYLAYIHPYFDVNGRTSRTMAMWYLLKNEAYPYIIFNRGISFKGSEYDKVIREAISFKDISFFLEYMLDTVKVELEKEYVMQSIASSTSEKLNGLDYQTLLYFLTMNGLKTVNDFASLYNRLNDSRRIKDIYETMLVPLLDKHILEIERNTKRFSFPEQPNMVLSLNKSLVDDDPRRIRRLNIR